MEGRKKFIIFLIHETIKTYLPLRKLKTNITNFSYITYQIQLILTSTFDDMRLLENVKILGLKNCLELIIFLNITSHNADGSGNSLEEGIPEVIPKRVCPCFYFTGLDLDFKILNN
ncbi:hypothetical protein Avbf_16793 [Armadillidium vulgare]|nr:hypothetical protein Avbf_16793 [Armadillidium vulgare]